MRFNRFSSTCAKGARFVAASAFFVPLTAASVRAEFCPDEGTVYPTGEAPFAAISCDLNGDGHPDIVTANADTDNVSVLLFNESADTFEPPALFPAGDEPVDIVCCDVDANDSLDLIVANRTPSLVNVLRNDGTGQFALDPAGPYEVGLAPWGVRCVDLNNNGLPDIVTANFTDESVTALINDGTGVFFRDDGKGENELREDYLTNEQGTFGLAVCDVNGNGHDDVIVSNIFGRSITVFRNNADGTLTRIDSFPLDNSDLSVFPWGIACCPLDGDDKPDVVSADGGNDRVTVIKNTSTAGTIQFGEPKSFPAGDNPFKVACGPLGAGSKTAAASLAWDVASANLESDDVSILSNTGDGTLELLMSLPVGGNAGSASISDINLTGDNDVLVAAPDGALVFENRCEPEAICGDGVVNQDEETCDADDDAVCAAAGTCRPPGDPNECTCCGDEIIQPEAGEECEPPNTETCDLDCRLIVPECGDGVVNQSEETCDADDDAVCAAAGTCRPPGDPDECTCCGDGLVQSASGEECDDGAGNSDTTPDACRTDCTLPICGDGVVDSGEECDNGAANSDTTPDACRTDCTLPICGDGVVDSGEECDDGAGNSDTTPDACRTDCTLPTCGDGVVDSGEECEPPNTETCDVDCLLIVSGDCEPPSVIAAGSRYIDVAVQPGASLVAIRISGAEPATACVDGFLGLDGLMTAAPVYALPSEWGTAHARGLQLVGGRSYSVRTDCDASEPGTSLSSAVPVTLWRTGDTDGNDIVSIADITRAVDGFRGIFSHPQTCTTDADCQAVPPLQKCNTVAGRCVWVTIENVDSDSLETPCVPDRVVSLTDILVGVDRFRGLPDPCGVACP